VPTRVSSHSSWKDKGCLMGRLRHLTFGLGLKSLKGVCDDTHGLLVFCDPLTMGEILWLRARSSWESPYVGPGHKRLTGHGRTID
jgi:hypothetical protein